MARNILSAKDGQVFGDRIAIGDSFAIRKAGRMRPAAKVRCKCGKIQVVEVRFLVTCRKCKSCALTIHGQGVAGKQTAEFRIWNGIIKRCTNPNDHEFDSYGGRGITICERWRQSFVAFFDDVGKRPSPEHSIDRFPNNDGNYEPGNVRWATRTQQVRNRSNTTLVCYRGVTKPLPQWADELQVGVEFLRARLRLGWTVDRAFEYPNLHRRRQRCD